jgi:hypothetical protein
MGVNEKGVRTPIDFYEVRGSELDSPARFAFGIDERGEYSCNIAPRAVYIGGSGNVYCRPSGGANNITYQHSNVFFYNVVGGTVLPLRVDKVWTRNESDLSQNTTATHLVGLY